MGMLTDLYGAGKGGAFGKRVQKRLGGASDPSSTVQQDAPSPDYAPNAAEQESDTDLGYGPGRRKRSNGKSRGY